MTNAVVASCVVEVPGVAVGATGDPVNAGEARSVAVELQIDDRISGRVRAQEFRDLIEIRGMHDRIAPAFERAAERSREGSVVFHDQQQAFSFHVVRPLRE